MNANSGELVKLTKKDFVSDQEVRWCPGCGDYAILAALQKVLPELGVPREQHVFISGIGCSSRFPYYMNSYGFHTIHGRAPAVATGVKLSNPELTVWVITGDGDALSIGGNHFLHALRRNINLNILLFNNRIYGLTKGQYSATSELGKVTKTSPFGTLDAPLNPSRLALCAGATFVARTVDVDPKHMAGVLKAAAEHEGVSFVEIYQNCLVFNDGAFAEFTERSKRPEHMLRVKNGQPLLFGDKTPKQLAFECVKPVIRSGAIAENQFLYDETNATMAQVITDLKYPDFPVPIGIFYRTKRPSYDAAVYEQMEEVTTKRGPGDLKSLLHGGNTWVV